MLTPPTDTFGVAVAIVTLPPLPEPPVVLMFPRFIGVFCDAPAITVTLPLLLAPLPPVVIVKEEGP